MQQHPPDCVAGQKLKMSEYYFGISCGQNVFKNLWNLFYLVEYYPVKNLPNLKSD